MLDVKLYPIQSIVRDTVIGDENAQVAKLFLNGTAIDENDCEFTSDENDITIKHLKIDLNQYKNHHDDNRIQMERVFTWTQGLDEDPIVSGYISRYVKGLEIKVKISDGFKIKFGSFRGTIIPDDCHHSDDGMGYEIWRLASSGELLLPEQTYFYAIIKEKNGEQEQ